MRVVVFGDLHGKLDAVDVELVPSRAPDGVVLLGDLAARSDGLAPAFMRALRWPGVRVWWTPGNHDCATMSELVSAIRGALTPREAMLQRLRIWSELVTPLMWAVEELRGLYVVGGRPFSLGGPTVAYPGVVASLLGLGEDVDLMAASTERLLSLVASIPEGAPVLVVSHNGPSGCGVLPRSPFGRDFPPAGGDWGDPDLGALVRRLDGRNPTLVLGGHMHRGLRGGGAREVVAKIGEVGVVNAAVVPRISPGQRAWVEVSVVEGGIVAYDVTADSGGEPALTELIRVRREG